MDQNILSTNNYYSHFSKRNNYFIALLFSIIIVLIIFISMKQGIKSKGNIIERIQSKHLYLIDECRSLSHLLSTEQQKSILLNNKKNDLEDSLTHLDKQIASIRSKNINTLHHEHYKTYLSRQYYKSSIVNTDNFGQILLFLTHNNNDITSIDLKLLYKSTLHGDTKRGLFRSIYNTDKILMLIKLETDLIIGGYSSIFWNWSMNDNGFIDHNDHFDYRIKQTHQDSFLFSLKENNKYTINNNSEGIVIDMDYFFTFNRDLEIHEGFLSEQQSYSVFPNKYSCVQRKTLDYELTSGWRSFKIKEIEVFRVIKTLDIYDKNIGM